MGDARNTADKVKDSINETIVEPAKKAGEAMRQSGAKVAEGGSTVSMKLLDQAEQNAREAFAALRAAAGAKDLSEVLSVQGAYLREQSNRSMAQAKEIGELIVKIGQESVAPLTGK
ncbi:phasin family protein [Sphingomonas sp. PB4P5]|uniref:phasin family protein n=1 Tax=Parasphingomonas puruogangriensis TaxID=3096155 RepID=UPI002FCB4113